MFLFALPRVLPIGVGTQIAILGLFALVFNLLFGYSGLLSFGHALFLGTRAYGAALLVVHLDGPPVAAILLAVLVFEGAIALVTGLLSLRLGGVYTLVALLVFLVLGFSFLLTRSTFGRALVAVRENEERTTALGVNTYRVKLIIFVISGMLTGMAGAL